MRLLLFRWTAAVEEELEEEVLEEEVTSW